VESSRTRRSRLLCRWLPCGTIAALLGYSRRCGCRSSRWRHSLSDAVRIKLGQSQRDASFIHKVPFLLWRSDADATSHEPHRNTFLHMTEEREQVAWVTIRRPLN